MAKKADTNTKKPNIMFNNNNNNHYHKEKQGKCVAPENIHTP